MSGHPGGDLARSGPDKFADDGGGKVVVIDQFTSGPSGCRRKGMVEWD